MGKKNDEIIALVNDKLNEVRQLLGNISNNYDFHFSLNFALFGKHKNQKIILGEGVYFNEFINTQVAGLFLARANQLKNNIDLVPNLLKQGYTVVICHDDEDKPHNFEGEWLVKNKIYIVMETRMTADKQPAYVLQNMNVKPPYDAFLARRFTRVMKNEMFN